MWAMAERVSAVGRFGLFLGQVLRRTLSPPWFPRAALAQCAHTFSRCAGPVLAVTVPFGMVIALQGLEIFDMFGAHRLLSSLVSVAMLRELAPVFVSVLVAAQGGSSVAAELGAMRIKEELDATEVMAVDGIRFHVIPRVLGMILACPLLHMVGAFAGLAGGYFTAVVVQGEQSGVFLANLWVLSSSVDVWAGPTKAIVFGATIGLISSFHGFHASGGAAGVGRAVNDTVVQSVLACMGLNYLMTSAMFGAVGP